MLKMGVLWEVQETDMPDRMLKYLEEVAKEAAKNYSQPKDIAAHIKREFDQKYNPTWHCVAGRNFGAYISCAEKTLCYFYVGKVAVMIFKSAPSGCGEEEQKKTQK